MNTKYEPRHYKSDQYVRWCPGCGDHAVLNCLHKAMAELGIPPFRMAVISGIGCSSRLPYYVDTYGFHTIHGRGAAIATGVKTARPDLSVWLVTGDGDCLAIGGNHFIHAVRRNVDMNVVLMNNKIYGLTKGQYSPTSERGFVTKSSPYGTVEDPFVPAELTLGARGTFFARSIDTDLKNLTDIFVASARHKGTSVVEILVNCVIFNSGTHAHVADRAFRDERTIFLRHGERMVFGKDRDKGLALDGLRLKVVDAGNDGILVHDAREKDPTLHRMLAAMSGELPVALGIIRDTEAPVYDESVHRQIAEVKAQKPARTLHEMLMSGEIWEIK